ncbi:MAG: hypothetical protein AB1529_00010 [Candidatus Micrarchaeota archaeon]
MRHALLFILLAALSMGQPFFTEQPREPTTTVIDQVTVIMQIIIPLMLTLVAVAVAVYMAGQMFGAETRARATVWAHGVLVAVGISAAMIAAVYIVLPGFFSGNITDFDVVQKIVQLRNLAASVLVALTLVLVIVAGAVYAAGMMAGAETRARASAWSSGLISGAIFTSVLYVLIGQLFPAAGGALEAALAVAIPGAPAGLGLYAFTVVQIVAFVAFFILITYLMSKVFKVPEWEAYLSIELSSLMSSFLLVFFVLGMFAVGSAVVMVYSGGGTTSPPQAAIGFMQGTVVDSTLMATIDVYKIQACTSILSTFSRRIGEFVLTQTYKVFPGLDTFVSITNVLGFTLLSLYNTAKVQVILMYVVDSFVLPFILPAGLVLRFFPPTRDAGAFLIALSFGFYVVFPLTYLLNAKIFEEVGARAYNAPGERPAALIQSLCGPFKYGVAGFLFNPSANPIYGLIPGGAVVGNALSRIVSEGLLNAISMAEFIPIMKHIGNLSLLALFMPALSMMVTIAFINAMTKFIVSKV